MIKVDPALAADAAEVIEVVAQFDHEPVHHRS